MRVAAEIGQLEHAYLVAAQAVGVRDNNATRQPIDDELIAELGGVFKQVDPVPAELTATALEAGRIVRRP